MAGSKYSKIARSKIDSERKRTIKRSMLIVKRIHQLRKKKDWTQQDLAEKLNISPSLISKWLSGVHNFTLETIERLEKVLGEPILSVTQEEGA